MICWFFIRLRKFDLLLVIMGESCVLKIVSWFCFLNVMSVVVSGF